MKIEQEFHENLEVLHVGCEPVRNYFIPFSKEEDVFKNRKTSDRVQFLNGVWDFKYFDSFYEAKHALETGITFTEELAVPANWQLHGFGAPVYTNDRYEIPYDPPYVPAENATGVYRKKTHIHKKDGFRYYLNFEGVDSCFYLFINETFKGYSQVTHCTSEFDVTDLLMDGENEIVAVVLRWCDGTYLEDQDKWRMSGIIRDVYLLERPEEHIKGYRILTEISDENRQGTITIEFQDYQKAINVVLRDTDGQVLDIAPAENSTVIFNVQNPRLWNAEQPYLYQVIIKTEQECIGEKVGIRTVSVKDGIITVNHVAVKLKGVNRHDSYPDTGAAASEEQIQKDLYLMKQHNINAIRCSHYPNAPFFLQMCDEIGFYVMDEADLEAHGSYHAAECTGEGRIAYTVQNQKFRKAILDRQERLVKRDRNRTSVIFWSLGNESGYGTVMEEAAKYIKSMDSSRLVHYESIFQLEHQEKGKDDETTLDVVSRMYASIPWIKEFLQDKNEKRPFIQCEYCHAMGNGPGDLEDYWRLFYSEERIAGGFIWEWCDHGIEKGRTEDGRIMYGYGGDFGEDMHDGNFCLDGLVYPDRTPHTGLLEAKQVYRPIRVKPICKDKGVYEFMNTCSFTALEDEWDCMIEIAEGGRVVCEKKADVTLKPLECKKITFPYLADLRKECSESVSVRFLFKEKKNIGWRAEDEIVGFDQTILAEKPFLLSKERSGEDETNRNEVAEKAAVEETYKAYRIIGRQYDYTISKFTGLPEKMIYDGEVILETPAKYQVFRAPVDNDRNIKNQWEPLHFKDFQQKVYCCQLRRFENCVEISTESGLGYKTRQNTLKIKQSLRIYSDGKIELKGKAKVHENRVFLPRFGVRLLLPNRFEDVSYHGYGPMESYIDKHQAAYIGYFENKVSELHEDYIRPQENGSHYGCDYLAVSDKRTKILVTSSQKFSFNASEYTAGELAEAAHNYELKKSGYTVLSLDYKMSGVGSNSCGPELAPEYQLKEKEFFFDFTVQMEKEKEKLLCGRSQEGYIK